MRLESVLTAAITDIAVNGFNSEIAINRWLMQLQNALKNYSANLPAARSLVEKSMTQAFERHFFDAHGNPSGKFLERNKGIDAFTLQRLKPKAQMKLQERIAQNASLIVLDRDAAVADTLKRFQGWTTRQVAAKQLLTKTQIKEQAKLLIKPVTDAPTDFVPRRRIIDQNNKMIASINDTIAEDGQALSMTWHQNWSANPRNAENAGKKHRLDPDRNHEQFDGKTFIRKECWAVKEGLLKKGKLPFLEDLKTFPGLNVYCGCTASYDYSLTALYRIRPDAFTAKGLERIGER
jgi:hypothetical protein